MPWIVLVESAMRTDTMTDRKATVALTRSKPPGSLGVTDVTPEVIADVTQRIVAAVDPQRIILFGSQARGDAAHGSDLDLLVIQDSPHSDREIRRRIEALLLDRRFGMDLIVRTPQEVEMNLADGNPFYTEHISRDGVVLYERAA